jgi:hypothetical protein
MNLAQIKTSDIPKRKLFQIERSVVREMTDLWFRQGCYFEKNFAENADIAFQGEQIKVTFKLTRGLKQGSAEATVNELMKSLILTMATDPHTGELLENYDYIIGNILDVFIFRLREIGDRKFLMHRLMTLDLGFRVCFGLGDAYSGIRDARRFLDEVLISSNSSTPEETVGKLMEAVRETEKLGLKEPGVTFHIVMENENEASCVCLPLVMQETNFVSLISEHTLRCNFIGTTTGNGQYQPRMFKIDAPTRPLQFVHHKGYHFEFDEQALMDKLASSGLTRRDFSPEELFYIKLLFNEYVLLAHFLLQSGMLDPDVRLVLIFPRLNFFSILHEEKPELPPDEPQTLGELAVYYPLRFRMEEEIPDTARTERTPRIPERVLQERRVRAIQALSSSTIKNLHNPLKKIHKDLKLFRERQLTDDKLLQRIRTRLQAISDFLKKLHSLKRIVIDEKSESLDLDSGSGAETSQKIAALDEISSNIQIAEIDPLREVITTKMLDYLSFVTVRLEQIQKVTAPAIREEIVEDLQAHTSIILSQSQAFYKLLVSSGWEVPRAGLSAGRVRG